MTVRSWMDHSTGLFLAAVGKLSDEQFAEATALPGWSRAHVVAHVHFNAEALLRLLHWARTGERTPMYEGPQQRAAEIEDGAALPPPELRRLLHDSTERLAAALDGLPQAAWNREVVTAQGRTVPAREVVWMRTREVAIHAVDLDTGTRFSDLPDDLNTALVADVAQKRCASGDAAALASWLTGRTAEAPHLGPWL